MLTSRNYFLKAINDFPVWMDVRKRPFKSIGGNYLQSIIEETDSISEYLKDFKKDFFLVNYIGRENTIIDYLQIGLVGEIEPGIKIVEPSLTLTTDIKEYSRKPTEFVFYQDGYFMAKLEVLGPDKTIKYQKGEFSYLIQTEKYHVWNIFDEFALFSGLNRFANETNAELLRRSFMAFKNPTNSTEVGLKNAIINALSNYEAIDKAEIIVTLPDESLLDIPDVEYENAYERLAHLNKDVYRTKQWDLDSWEHNFKTLSYIPHIWDAPLPVSQNGVGQGSSLSCLLTDDIDKSGATSVKVTGYQKSEIIIDEYVRDRKIERKIGIQLKKYDDALKPQEVEYKITAATVKELQADKIILNSYIQSSGEGSHFIEDILLDNRGASIEQRGLLLSNKTYKLKFFPQTDYTTMAIDKAQAFVNDNQPEELLQENASFKKVNNVFQNIDVKFHGKNLRDFTAYKNMKNVASGITINDGSEDGHLSIDITGLGGKTLKYQETCKPVDISRNQSFVNANGFTYENGRFLAANENQNSELRIELDCNFFSFELETADNPSLQGSCTCLVTIDGKVDTQLSGLMTTGRLVQKELSKFSHVKVELQKTGMNPVAIRKITAARYEISYETSKGALVSTPFGYLLPILPESEPNTLSIRMKSYSSFSPIINFVHIGAALTNAVYETKEIQTGHQGGYIKITSNCLVKLYQVENGKEVLAESDFITKNLYKNNTLAPVALILDTSKFQNIVRSTPTIKKTTESGHVVEYIILQPGESIDRVIIEGESLVLVESAALSKWLYPPGSNYKTYVSKAIKGFIVSNTNNGEEFIVNLTRNKLSGTADIFRFAVLPQGILAGYVINEDESIEIFDNNYSFNFQELFITPLESKEYVAYNKATVFQPKVTGVPIVNTFMPLLSGNELLVYILSEVSTNTVDTEVTFEKLASGVAENVNWSLGQKKQGITIQSKLGFDNNNSYELEIKQLNESFIISNTIDLADTYLVEDTEAILARYIITPPAGMKVLFEEKIYSEELIIQEDGFNKLFYSNVLSINDIKVNNVPIAPTDFLILPTEGILVWQNLAYQGKRAQIFYKYKHPKCLSFIDIESLYELAEYSLDAYKRIDNELSYHGLMDGDSKIIDFGVQPDKVVVSCSNPSFSAVIESNRILRVKKANTDNVMAVKTGYFYDDGLEYYHFSNEYREIIDKMNNVTLYNVRRLGNNLVFSQRSTNHILDSAMRVARLYNLCEIDFVNNLNIQGLSRLNALTACESYNNWQDFDMSVDFVKADNGYALKFSANSAEAYALFDLSTFIWPDSLLTFVCFGPINCLIAREIKIDGMRLGKSVFVEPYKVINQDSSYLSFVFDKDLDQSCRYYLMVTGSGVIDDIIIKAYTENENMLTLHTKNIDHLGLTVNERAKASYLHYFTFSTQGNRYIDTEILSDGIIQTGANVDWGLTRLFDSRTDESNLVLIDAKEGKEAIYSDGRNAKVITPPIYLRNKKSINNLYVKINDALFNKMTGMNIRILTANSAEGVYNEVAHADSTNVLKVLSSKLLSYVKVQVEMPPSHVLQVVEVFVAYKETETPLKINTSNQGALITKVFDAGYTANFKPERIICKRFVKKQSIKISVRAAREDMSNIVWTDWKEFQLDSNFYITNVNLVFENYRLFQFKIELLSKEAQIAVEDFVFEVIE